MDDLAQPLVISRGMADGLAKLGYSFDEFLEDPDLPVWRAAHNSPHWAVSGARALATIQNDMRWRRGEIAYIEAHCYSVPFSTWFYGMVAPISDRGVALIEAAHDPDQRQDYWVKFVPVEDDHP